MTDNQTTSAEPLRDNAYESHNWLVVALAAQDTAISREAIAAIQDLWAEIFRLREEAAEMLEHARIEQEGAAHNASIDRNEIGYWKERAENAR